MKKGKLSENSKIVIHTDGGSRGNPGPAAIGVVIESNDPSALLGANKEYGDYLGEKTNNQAEYAAVVFALKKLKQLIGKKKTAESEVEIVMDSELVVKQLNGEYKILEPELQPLFLEIWNLRLDFKSVKFRHVPRGKNSGADRIVNEVLDKKGGY